jgi:hemerythrin-like domain-containing protein
VGHRVVPENPPGTSGLPRHPALIALSREHHLVLRQALWLRRAADAAAPDAARRPVEEYLVFYEREILPHVAEEEEVLLPMAGHADPEGAERILAEHRELATLTAALRSALDRGDDTRPAVREVGDLLHDHVRFEERVFFMRVQAGLSPAALDELLAAVQRRPRSCALPLRSGG